MSLFGSERDVDAIAEYADSSVRVMSRKGSLVLSGHLLNRLLGVPAPRWASPR